ncbi:desulfoferrodoxin [Candidatus Woesearchaeota archaeon]|nr:desulfoferrodoxin [Candidatus Woesearchaeota archaeon]
MAEKNVIYKCEICGNVVLVVEAHEGELVCCGQPMKIMVEKTAEQEGNEKHVPVLEKTDLGVKVKVGSVLHPMEEKHYIDLIQLVKDNEVIFSKMLNPEDEPIAEFCIADTEGLKSRVLCNIHGLWKD